MNYVLMKLAAGGRISLCSSDFMIWGFSDEAKRISIDSIAERRGYNAILHYAGAKPCSIIEFPAAEILRSHV